MISDLSDANIYHRDLNLSNVMYDAENQRFCRLILRQQRVLSLVSSQKLSNDAQMFEKSLHALAQQKLESLQSNKVNRRMLPHNKLKRLQWIIVLIVSMAMLLFNLKMTCGYQSAAS